MTANNFVSPREENLNGVQSREINVSGRERWISIAGFRRFFLFFFLFSSPSSFFRLVTANVSASV